MVKTQEQTVRKRRHLTPEDKFQIFMETTIAKAKENGSISEVLRRWGIHSSDLTNQSCCGTRGIGRFQN